MIGVLADPSEHAVVREFFELFKTPWEFYRSGRQYDVLLCAGDGDVPRGAAKLVLIYSGQADGSPQAGQLLAYKEHRIPVYGSCVAFDEQASGFLVEAESRRTVGYLEESIARIGYDLFHEVRFLLTKGQPVTHAAIPTLDLHIAMLRDLIVASGVGLVEIPPVPEGYQFIVCLTHDVDHPSIRSHKFDHTMFGFLYRAVVGSTLSFLRRRLSVRELIFNWAAAAKLPFVYLGLAKDFWREFGNGYRNIEKDVRSTFFVIPFKNRQGSGAPKRRAARYGADDIADVIRGLQARGCEVALHGIDAWRDSSLGRNELEQIRRLTGASTIGVRMHWLYFDEQSPGTLEEAGADYDSTMGYNATVGYRAGTLQPYIPPGAARLLELPLHAMDTALFYPSYLGLSQPQAQQLLGEMTGNAVRLGGCFTINWHDRSISPERLWGACYQTLVEDLKDQRAWFATASEVVAWFRKRRSVVFETDSSAPDRVRARAAGDREDDLPGLLLRVHQEYGSRTNHTDTAFDERMETRGTVWSRQMILHF